MPPGTPNLAAAERAYRAAKGNPVKLRIVTEVYPGTIWARYAAADLRAIEDKRQKSSGAVKVAVGLYNNRQTRWLKPGQRFRDFAVAPEMVVIPPGHFLMGSPKNEPERDDDEGPQQRVRIPQAFAMGRFAVTFAEWDACVADGGCNGYKPSDQGWGRGNRPVINVSWHDAKAYVCWLNKKLGARNCEHGPYRLASEAEWEYAARAGTTGPFSFAGKISADKANYDATYTYNGSKKGRYRAKTVPVDSFQPNGFGLYQMHGNVWEWVEDCYHNNYQSMQESIKRTEIK